ncbi:MAG: hypothetical protein HONBIEJF_01492 [Fimbriimonadaceae bacterium]|nr:hypothetical protein [Fimbriimonadaceae bacterium]
MTAIIAAWLVAQSGGHARFDLLTDSSSIQAGKAFWIAARFRIDPGWHIYWKNPGDSGVPTSVTLKLPQGFRAEPFNWPGPTRFVDGEIVNYGYAAEAVLVAKVTPPKSMKLRSKATIRAEASWMACKEMCVMGAGRGSLSLVAGPSPKPKVDFSSYRSRLPVPAPAATAAFKVKEGVVELWWKAKPGAVAATYFFPEATDLIQVGAPQAQLTDENGGRIGLRLPVMEGKTPPSNLSGVLEFALSPNKPRYFIVNAPCKRAD